MLELNDERIFKWGMRILFGCLLAQIAFFCIAIVGITSELYSWWRA